jgi:hypothetical protein
MQTIKYVNGSKKIPGLGILRNILMTGPKVILWLIWLSTLRISTLTFQAGIFRVLAKSVN